jgi:hypothetical protein
LRILLLNHKTKACGVYNFGKRVYELASQSKKIEFFYREADSFREYEIIKSSLNPEVIIYNWHRGTMAWLPNRLDKKVRHDFIFHEEVFHSSYDHYLFFGDYDISHRIPKNKSILFPRPLLPSPTKIFPQNEKVTIGTFGFPFWQKGLHTLVEYVNKNLNYVTLNFLTPNNDHIDKTGVQSEEVLGECLRLNTNPTVNLNINRKFLPDEAVVDFLAQNDINVFLYSENGEGISSVIDYALSARKPIAISNCKMFRHIWNPEIIFAGNLWSILEKGTKPIEKYYSLWSREKFVEEMEKIYG